jgi:Ca2+-binding RTX toxin-like protein
MTRYTGDNNNDIFTAPNDGLAWVISGKGGDDILIGGNNNDVIDGDEGNDSLYGRGGNDIINGGEGYDYIYGEDGDDILVDTQGSVDGGAGIDFLKADYSLFDNGAGIHVGWLGYNIIFSRVDGSGLLTYNNVERFEITGTKYVDILQGYAYNDNLNGGAGDDEIFGGGGNDNLIGGAGFDYLNGGDGNDNLIDIQGIVDGGAGTDTLKADYSQFNNGVGIEVGYNGESAIYSKYTSSPSNSNSGNNSSYSPSVLLRYSNVERFEITGTQYNDILRGGAGNDTLNGGGGYNYLFGGAGNDILINIQGTVDGGAGTDTLIADYSLFNNGVGIEVGYNGQNAIYSNDNSILPGSINAYNAFPLLTYSNVEKFEITGTQYADKLRGGAGNDILDGGDGTDTVFYEGYYADYGISFLNNGDLQVIDQNTANGNEGTDTIKNAEFISFAQGGTYALVTGGIGDDTLTASNNYSSFVFGGDGNDILNGGIGNDNLVGGLGNDILVGDFGSDTLTGGLGADKFVFNSLLDSSDVIKDFNSAEGDKIQVSQLGFSVLMSIGSSGIVDHNSFSYNNATGGLFYLGTQFATLENKPTDFVVSQDILIV